MIKILDRVHEIDVDGYLVEIRLREMRLFSCTRWFVNGFAVIDGYTIVAQGPPSTGAFKTLDQVAAHVAAQVHA